MAHIKIGITKHKVICLWHFDTAPLHNPTKHIFIYTWIIIYFQQCHSDIILLNMSPLHNTIVENEYVLGCRTQHQTHNRNDKFEERRGTITYAVARQRYEFYTE